mmetsp:Transcript_55879/g.118837  ORF Transcript_55879/g.118837 Transcript_55879/m.118837 type:complete len:101 (+) Transcript_55879:217-519(+)
MFSLAKNLSSHAKRSRSRFCDKKLPCESTVVLLRRKSIFIRIAPLLSKITCQVAMNQSPAAPSKPSTKCGCCQCSDPLRLTPCFKRCGVVHQNFWVGTNY